LGLLQREVAVQIGVTKEVIHNWETGHAEPAVGHYPVLIEFLGYSPLPEPKTRGQAVRRERMSRGWSIARLAKESGVDPATVGRVERDCERMVSHPVAKVLGALGLLVAIADL
jgi:transcriptional regulator with XRE-family HTH domain